MFRNFLYTANKASQLDIQWVKKLPGLIRVVIPDSNPDATTAFVIVYYEQKNQYALVAFDIHSGEVYWTKEVPNGGYGAPAIINDLIILPTKFSNVIAISKKNGDKKWEVETTSRVRSPINIVNDKVYFSSGGTIFELFSTGKITKKWDHPGAFFYGSVDVIQGLVLSLGTIEDVEGRSLITVFAFHKDGHLAYKLPISEAPIVSADTSGIIWKDKIGVVGGENVIVAFEATNGKILWTCPVEGFAGRQVCSIHNEHVYYVTQLGVIGALRLSDGFHAWKINTEDQLLVSPISIMGENLLVLADAHLNVLRSSNGQLIQKTPIGHSPYSMISVRKDYGLLGAGEPPHNGLLFGFKLSSGNTDQKYSCIVKSSNAFSDVEFVDILVEIVNSEVEITRAHLDGTIFNLENPVVGEKLAVSTFTFRVKLPLTMSSGDFVIPIHLFIASDKFVTRPLFLRFTRKKPLLTRAYLYHIPNVLQEKPLYSGAAIGSMIKKLYGNCTLKQSNLREMVDASRTLSGYEPFQSWRIILRRLLTSNASVKEELPEFAQDPDVLLRKK